MSDQDEGMQKLGVKFDENKTKTAEKGKVQTCALCGNALDDAGACPVHGTEPLEPDHK